MEKSEIKDILYGLGADLCGVAAIDRFGQAPKGYHPIDTLPSCKSVVVFAVRFLAGTLDCLRNAPYYCVRNTLSTRLDDIAVRFCEIMEEKGVLAVPTGTIGPTEMDAATGRMRNIISAKHAAQAAGMGVIGKNTLLMTPEFGNMVWLHAILTDLPLESDPLMDIDYCSDCDLCVSVCPVGAVGKPELDQQKCAAYMFGSENGGDFSIKCYKCRQICPHARGTRNAF